MSESAYIPLYTAAAVRELDRIAIEDRGIPGYALMCRAGKALAKSVTANWPDAGRVCVLCGGGNNGGDGYVVARLLRGSGIEVTLQSLTDPARLHGDAATAAADYVAAGGCVEIFSGDLPASVDLFVDALLGTGLDRPVDGVYRQAIEAMNGHAAPVLAVDIPSGLHADSGRVLGIAVEAQRTLTFIGRKRGLYTGAGKHYAGSIEFDDLGVPPDVYAGQPVGEQLVEHLPLGPLGQPRRRDAHKGDFGHVLIVGGNAGMGGAARMAAEAAARCGAGLVSVATRPEHAASLNAGCPELMVHGVNSLVDLKRLLARATVVVVGPGLGQTAWAHRLFEAVLDSDQPLVVDADALNLLAQAPLRRDNWILTPHPGEAARLLRQSTAHVQEDRFAAVRGLVGQFAGVAVLKGAGSLVAAGTPAVRVCAGGNPGMASGGMGDVLSGVLAALLAQGMEPFDAATAGVCMHARAADLAVSGHGERGLLASDLIPVLRGLVNGLA